MDELALPLEYLTDQPDLELHYNIFNSRVKNFSKSVIEKISDFLDGTVTINETWLATLEEHWIRALKRLAHSQAEINDKHLYRPIEVRCCSYNPNKLFIGCLLSIDYRILCI